VTGKIGRPARADRAAAWESVRDRLRARGLRWTPQRRALVDVLSRTDGHITGSELVERCRVVDPATIPSTVYRTLDVLEDLGYVRHHHGVDGREEFHVLPSEDHGHFHCQVCGTSWEISPEEGAGTTIFCATAPELAGVSGRYYERQRESMPSAVAQDDALAARLWDESEKLVGLPP